MKGPGMLKFSFANPASAARGEPAVKRGLRCCRDLLQVPGHFVLGCPDNAGSRLISRAALPGTVATQPPAMEGCLSA